MPTQPYLGQSFVSGYWHKVSFWYAKWRLMPEWPKSNRRCFKT